MTGTTFNMSLFMKILCGLIAYALFLMLFVSHSKMFYAPLFESQESVSDDDGYVTYLPEERKPAPDDSAYVMMALGASANTMNCPAAIETLVRYGGWNGHVYLLTDRESCFDREEIISNAGMEREHLHIQKVEGDFGSGGVDILHPSVGTRRKRLESLSMKTRLFDYIPEQTIKKIAYVDCDILFAEKNCALEFMAGGPPEFADSSEEEWLRHRIKFSWLLREEDGSLKDIHCGTFLAHREHTKELMDVWRNEIVNNHAAEGDNDAFMAVYRRIQQQNKHEHHIQKHAQQAQHSSNTGGNSTITTNNNGIVDSNDRTSSSIPSLSSMTNLFEPAMILKADEQGKMSPIDLEANRFFERRYEKFIDSQKHLQPICMNHISKARCNAGGRQAMQGWIDQLKLRTYGPNQYYCVHPALTPLMYGWFPFSYIPYCPKVETWL